MKHSSIKQAPTKMQGAILAAVLFLLKTSVAYVVCGLGVRTGTLLSCRAAAAESEECLMDRLARLALVATKESYAEYEMATDGGTGMSMSGRDKEGTWLLPKPKQELQLALADIKAKETSNALQYLASSPSPLVCSFLSHASCEITLLSVPSNEKHAPRRHPAGTILLYKRLYGGCELVSIMAMFRAEKREVKREVLDETEVMVRLGGMSRVLESTTTSPAAVLEIALYPPSRLDEGLSDGPPFDDKGEETKHMYLVQVGEGDRRDMFESAAVVEAEKERREQEAKALEQATPLARTRALVKDMKTRVGGLDEQLDAICRRVLYSRQLPQETLDTLGVGHVKGILMFGPPGVGKTLVARQLARMLDARDPIIVNGPEIFDKYVGEAERNVRALFAPAEEEWAKRGPASALHVIVLDEIDAIAKKRTGGLAGAAGGGGGDGASVRDSVVNQLLSKIDGVNEQSNILVVGLTNRIDLIDSALLRPGRLEVHLELLPPSRQGRRDILSILTKLMKEKHLLQLGNGNGDGNGGDDDAEANAYLDKLSRKTRGWTGAELSGLVRNAASFAMERAFEKKQSVTNNDVLSSKGDVRLAKKDGESVNKSSNSHNVVLTRSDFERAHEEIKRQRFVDSSSSSLLAAPLRFLSKNLPRNRNDALS